MTVPLARSTAEYLCTVHNELGPGWFRALAGELTAEDPEMRMTDLGEVDMGFINYRPELEGKREYHQHGENKYIIGANGKCWFCGQTVKTEPNPAQLVLGSQPQLKMEV